jgi:hypothetical protein
MLDAMFKHEHTSTVMACRYLNLCVAGTSYIREIILGECCEYNASK